MYWVFKTKLTLFVNIYELKNCNFMTLIGLNVKMALTTGSFPGIVNYALSMTHSFHLHVFEVVLDLLT